MLWVLVGSINAAAARQPSAAFVAPESAQSRERTQLLQRGEAALARLEVQAALDAFDRAAGISHAVDTELGLVRTYMQAGEYRRALAFVAHTAQAHREVAGGAALHAWLLHVGGHGVNAMRTLTEAEQRFPNNQLLALTRRQLESRAPVATGPLLKAPARLAPMGPAPGLPVSARVVGSGVLIDSGKRAVVPLVVIGNATRLWVRNGLGQFSRAVVQRRLNALEVAIVELDAPIIVHAGLFAPSEPFPGSVAFAVAYVVTEDATPSWPLLISGFIGLPSADGAHRQLAVELPRGARGGPVFDAAGRTIGMAMRSSAGDNWLLAFARLGESIVEMRASSAPTTATARMPVDQIYESALRTTLQVIVTR